MSSTYSIGEAFQRGIILACPDLAVRLSWIVHTMGAGRVASLATPVAREPDDWLGPTT